MKRIYHTDRNGKMGYTWLNSCEMMKVEKQGHEIKLELRNTDDGDTETIVCRGFIMEEMERSE